MRKFGAGSDSENLGKLYFSFFSFGIFFLGQSWPKIKGELVFLVFLIVRDFRDCYPAPLGSENWKGKNLQVKLFALEFLKRMKM
jgi:hypothetical protein